MFLGRISTVEEDVIIKTFADYVTTIRDTDQTDSDSSEIIIHNSVYDDLHQEVQVIRNLFHDHIVLFYSEIDMKGYYGYVMEYCRGGSLHDYIIKHGPMSEKKIRIVMKQMLDALDYLSQHKIVHRYNRSFNVISRDIKTANILICKEDYYKLCDFGSCSVIKVPTC